MNASKKANSNWRTVNVEGAGCCHIVGILRLNIETLQPNAATASCAIWCWCRLCYVLVQVHQAKLVVVVVDQPANHLTKQHTSAELAHPKFLRFPRQRHIHLAFQQFLCSQPRFDARSSSSNCVVAVEHGAQSEHNQRERLCNRMPIIREAIPDHRSIIKGFDNMWPYGLGLWRRKTIIARRGRLPIFDMLQNQLEILMFYFDFTMWPVLVILGCRDS